MLLPLTIKYWVDASNCIEKEIAVNPESIMRIEPSEEGCLVWCERMNEPYHVLESLDNLVGAVNALTIGIEETECKPDDSEKG